MSTPTRFVSETNIRIDDDALFARAQTQPRSAWHRHIVAWYEAHRTPRGLPRFSFAALDDTRLIGYVDDDLKSLLRSIESAMQRVPQSASDKTRFGTAKLEAPEIPAEAALRFDHAQGRLTLHVREWIEVPLGARTAEKRRSASTPKAKKTAAAPRPARTTPLKAGTCFCFTGQRDGSRVRHELAVVKGVLWQRNHERLLPRRSYASDAQALAAAGVIEARLRGEGYRLSGRRVFREATFRTTLG